MSELKKMPEKKDRWSDFQKDYNLSSKKFVRIIGTNITLFICMLLPLLLIGFIWTDFGLPKISFKLISDGIVTVALFAIGELMMMRIGASGGKLDNEYITEKRAFDELMEKVNDIGTMFISMFCEWQIDLEMRQATTTRLRYLRFTKEDYERVKDLPYNELMKKYGIKKARRITELNQLDPVELNEAILLFNSSDTFARGGVPISGEEYIQKKSHSAGMILSAIFTGLLTVSIAITLTSDISFSRVTYTVFRFVVLLYRMAVGYDLGAKAYNTVEVRQLRARNNYLRQYVRFVEDKTYLKLGDKYGDIKCYLKDEEPITTNE